MGGRTSFWLRSSAWFGKGMSVGREREREEEEEEEEKEEEEDDDDNDEEEGGGGGRRAVGVVFCV